MQDHFLIHRPDNLCYPFIVKNGPGVGRFLVASRDIKPCELILRELPAVFGPYTPTSPLCLTCFTKLDITTTYLCPNCGLPFCKEECSTSPMHKQVRMISINITGYYTRNVTMRFQETRNLTSLMLRQQKHFSAVLQSSGTYITVGH